MTSESGGNSRQDEVGSSLVIFQLPQAIASAGDMGVRDKGCHINSAIKNPSHGHLLEQGKARGHFVVILKA
jgi:hypothetical protein